MELLRLSNGYFEKLQTAFTEQQAVMGNVWAEIRFQVHSHGEIPAIFSRLYAAVIEAVHHGDLDMIRWLFAQFSGCVVEVQAVEAAAAAGNLCLLEFFLHNERAFQDAQEGAEINDSNEIQWGGADMAAAVEKGYPDVARWLFEQKGGVERDWGRFMAAVGRSGSLELLQWLLDRGYTERQLAPPTMDDAAWGGHIDMLQWLYRHGYVHHASFALEHAARNGHLEIVEWLMRYHPVGNASRALDAAARENHLHVVRWLLEHNLGRGAKSGMHQAAIRGHLEVAQYLHEQSFDGLASVSSGTMLRAAGRALQHVIDDGGARRLVARLVARWPLEDMDTFYRQAQLSVGLVNAAQRGNTKLVRWLLGNIVSERFTVDSRSGIFKAVEAAATVGHLNILEQVLVYDKRGVCIKPAMVSAARGSKLDALKWLHKRLSEQILCVCLWQAPPKVQFQEVILKLSNIWLASCLR
ncbi:hypothetical protein PInf_004225 [Phytophthora infestans]|nr:hypothetical protein PInf_004225 [Phytophthora infestans]